ncbi:hypothetical protein RZO07_11095 [Pseudomonas protegens]|uniref:hypothetical protein n=1 Tax=Pseudomonas protegens TaxID=380021 RepID=UPI00293733FE|nr:hypothetical protein [Pseudomonas protegens]WOE81728.1 hypothetical protein RZO07_11095 [Pseudomonas protegens]
MSVKDAEWQSRWNARDAAYKQAWALADKAECEKEQARQDSINKAVQNGQRKSMMQWLMLLPLALLLGACSVQSTTSPDALQVKASAIPAMPSQAWQQPAQSWCLSTCSSALTSEREIWQQMLI